MQWAKHSVETTSTFSDQLVWPPTYNYYRNSTEFHDDWCQPGGETLKLGEQYFPILARSIIC
jgi:hypothetical protein